MPPGRKLELGQKCNKLEAKMVKLETAEFFGSVWKKK